MASTAGFSPETDFAANTQTQSTTALPKLAMQTEYRVLPVDNISRLCQIAG